MYDDKMTVEGGLERYIFIASFPLSYVHGDNVKSIHSYLNLSDVSVHP